MRKNRITALALALPVCAFAASDIVITLQPQNLVYPEGSVATYTVEATGSNLHYSWYIVYNGMTYDTTKLSEGYQPWLDNVMESSGTNAAGNSYWFQGICAGFDGAEIYCEVEDGHNYVRSSSAIIQVSGNDMPPVTRVPAGITVSKNNNGNVLKLFCDCNDPYDDCHYQWYETFTGGLREIRAMDLETSSVLVADTSVVGTRYYVCYVVAPTGGRAYSSVIPVTVTDSAAAEEAETYVDIEITQLPKTLYYSIGAAPDLSGMKARIYTSLGFIDSIDGDSFSVSPSSFTNAGKQNVTISCGGISESFEVEVGSGVPQKPVIDVQPEGCEISLDITKFELSVTAHSVDGGALSYQWYVSQTGDAEDETAIEDGTSPLLEPERVKGTAYYRVAVTNTASSGTSDPEYSDLAKVTFLAKGARPKAAASDTDGGEKAGPDVKSANEGGFFKRLFVAIWRAILRIFGK